MEIGGAVDGGLCGSTTGPLVWGLGMGMFAYVPDGDYKNALSVVVSVVKSFRLSMKR